MDEMRKSFIGIGAAIILASGATIATSVVAHAADEPGAAAHNASAPLQIQPKVQLVMANGSGCPSGIPGASVAYNDGIELKFNEMLAVRAAGASNAAALQENCQVSLAVAVPDGFTYAVSTVKSNTRVALAKGASARVEQTAYVQGVSSTNYVGNDIPGPLNGDVQLSAGVANAPSFAPCDADRNLNLNTRVILNNSGSAAADAGNKAAITGPMKIMLNFKKC